MKIQLTLFATCAGLSLAAAPQWTVTVDDTRVVRPIKMMNAVNNGPVKPMSEQSRGNFEDYAALKIPYARIHDGGHYYYYGLNHAVDITGIFPNFDADVNDPASYDFELTDRYLQAIRAAGTEPYFRLGQSIEHWHKKYGVRPPKGVKASDVRVHLTDLDFTYTETPLLARPDGTTYLKMMPNSFALLKW